MVESLNEETTDFWTLLPTETSARIFVQQWGIFTRHSRRCWAFVVGNCPVVEVRRFITRENLYEEEGDVETSHYEKLVRIGLRAGLSREQIDEAQPLPSTSLALLAWEALTKHYSWGEGLAAKAVLERIGFPDLRRIREANWRRELHLTDEEADFFTTHIVADEVHGSGAYALLEQYVSRQDETRILVAAQVSLHAMALFCDGIAAAMRSVETSSNRAALTLEYPED